MIESLKTKETSKSFLFIKLNKGIEIKNLVTYMITQFFTFVMIGLSLSFVNFILENPDYYNINSNDIGAKLAPIGMWAEAITIF